MYMYGEYTLNSVPSFTPNTELTFLSTFDTGYTKHTLDDSALKDSFPFQSHLGFGIFLSA